jgi:PAS domain S-box-containing protein
MHQSHQNTPSHSPISIAISTVALATVVRIILHPVVGEDIPFNSYYFAVMFATWYGGIRAAVMVLVSGSILGLAFSSRLANPSEVWDYIDFFRWLTFASVTLFSVLLYKQQLQARQTASERKRLAEETSEQLQKVIYGRNKLVEQLQEALYHVDQERRLLSTVLEALPVGVFIADENGKIVKTNVRGEQIWRGADPNTDSIAGYKEYHGWWADTGEKLKPEDWAMARALLKGEVSTGEVIDIRRFDGTAGTILNSGAPVMDAEGKITGGVVAVQDITTLKQSERKLQESEARYQALVHATSDAIVIHDRGLILDVNPAFEKTFGVRRSEVAGKNYISNFVSPEDHERFQSHSKTEGERLYEAHFIQRNGEQFVGEVHSKPIVYNGLPARVASIRDITARHQMQQQERQITEERARIDAIIGFVRDVSHDFRTPISVINTSLYLLQKQTDPSRQAFYAERIEQQTTRINKLVNGLVRMSQLDRGESFSFARQDVYHLLHIVEARTEPLAKKKGVYLQLHSHPEPLYVCGDAIQLADAIIEIVENAIIHTESGGRVMVKAARDFDDCVKITVEDTGAGIEPDELPHIFNRLYRVDKARSVDTGGAGLGLAIAMAIVKAHQGRIDVQSEVGKGSTFTVVLPTNFELCETEEVMQIS